MRLLMLTAGAGGMYCGSCLRDNRLATELLARGHDLTLLPIYTPTLTDERNVSDAHVFYGGISVYLEQYVPVFRHTPALFDKLLDSPALIRSVAGRSVSTDPHLLGGMTVSMLKGEQGFQAKELRKLLAWVESEPPFDVISLPFALLLGLAGPLRRATGRPVVCTLQGEDLFLEALQEPYKREALALIAEKAAEISAFIAVSGFYADFMAGYLKLPRERLRVAPLGIHVDAFPPRRARAEGPVTIGSFARIAPEKGLHLLAEAYVLLRRELGIGGVRLEAAGYLGPDQKDYLARVVRTLEQAGLSDEFRCHGTLPGEAKLPFLHSLDLLATPSPYAEPKGLYVLEALAAGVPVVAPRHGAFPEIFERAPGGVLFEPGNVRDLAERLATLTADEPRRRELSQAGARGVREHYHAQRMAESVESVFAEVVGRRAGAS
jgi:glycosyltransferase involved in cell wall biosynthesis